MHMYIHIKFLRLSCYKYLYTVIIEKRFELI